MSLYGYRSNRTKDAKNVLLYPDIYISKMSPSMIYGQYESILSSDIYALYSSPPTLKQPTTMNERKLYHDTNVWKWEEE